MTREVLASFKATDGTGVWEVTSTGVYVGGEFYQFTDASRVNCCGTPGRSETHTRVEETPSDFGLLEAWAVYRETESLGAVGLAACALGGPSVNTVVEARKIPGNVQLTVGGLSQGRAGDITLRYREEGRWVQVDAVQHFADVTLAAIRAYRNRSALSEPMRRQK